eukprot:CAMPEP_0204365386 /NCGR_PEP_ID=MMETSP0469-20131031/41874_1 /ASSEMBLY_ACC=CAM_ASM_000384 /TAXON_ID=2969 /ORGANISM="Oxyrrhis marina" /LENGTH=443 /DNA_ID=CAMNT_0051354441 /DNA_START=24 /DNA_END=1355 /DNA_ORIENTATION=-
MAAENAKKVWDAERGCWVEDTCNLADMEAKVMDLPSDEESEAEEQDREAKAVAETAFYDLLKVAPAASASEIKKAYYKEALRCHPDKCGNDPEAKDQFQKLSEAYSVLSDPVMRDKYDRHGKEGVSEKMSMIDPTLFFSVLFGSEQFEPYVGKLMLASHGERIAKDIGKGDMRNMDQMRSNMGSMNGAKMQRAQKRQHLRRVVKCAKHMREKLDKFVHERDEHGFAADLVKEATELSNASFGPQLLAAIGEVYLYTADEFLNLSGAMGAINTKGRELSSTVRVATSLGRSVMAVKKMHDTLGPQGAFGEGADQAATPVQGDGTATAPAPAAGTEGEGVEPKMTEDEKRAKAAAHLEESLPFFLDSLWEITTMDIQTALKDVCKRLLQDVSVPWQIRCRRAMGMRRLGRIFSDAASVRMEGCPDKDDAKSRLEQAFMTAAQKAR